MYIICARSQLTEIDTDKRRRPAFLFPGRIGVAAREWWYIKYIQYLRYSSNMGTSYMYPEI